MRRAREFRSWLDVCSGSFPPNIFSFLRKSAAMLLFSFSPYGTWQSALCISCESALRLLSVKIIWQNGMLAMEQQERFQGEGGQSWGLQPLMLVLAVPFTSPATPHYTPPLSELLHAPLLISHAHVFGTWGEEVEEGEWDGIAGWGEQGDCNARK